MLIALRCAMKPWVCFLREENSASTAHREDKESKFLTLLGMTTFAVEPCESASIRGVDSFRGRGRPAPQTSHAVVIRSPAAFRRDPSDDLVRVGDVAGFAVDAVRWVQ